jgi:hypothetical protein
MDERVLLAVRDTSFRGADPAAPLITVPSV